MLNAANPEFLIMKDITTRKDIEKLMAAFYDTLLHDDAINYIFTDVAQINIPEHLPHIVDFWEQNLISHGNYSKNVLQIHLDLNGKTALTANHFKIWLKHLNQTADSLFHGQNTEKLKTRALSIATIMQIKLQENAQEIN